MSRHTTSGEVIRQSEYAQVISWLRSDIVRLYLCPACHQTPGRPDTLLGDPTQVNLGRHPLAFDGDKIVSPSYHLLTSHKPSDFGLSPLTDGRDPYGADGPYGIYAPLDRRDDGTYESQTPDEAEITDPLPEPVAVQQVDE